MKHRRHVLAVTLLAAALGLAACSTNSPTSSSPSTQPTGLAPGSPAAASTSTPTRSSTQSIGATKVSGTCSSIDRPTAQSILGFATAAGSSSKAGASTPGFGKIDGCVYKSVTDGSLGYTVLLVSAQSAQAAIGAAKARLANAGANVTAFDAGLANSVAFSLRVGAGVDSQVAVVTGNTFITVAATRKDGDAAKSQASATAAAKSLVAHA